MHGGWQNDCIKVKLRALEQIYYIGLLQCHFNVGPW